MPLGTLALFVLKLMQDMALREKFNRASTQGRKDMATAEQVPIEHLDALASGNVSAINEHLRIELQTSGAIAFVIEDYRIFPPVPPTTTT
jgi:hypothetical protein